MQGPAPHGFQNAADGSVEKRHPLHACFSKLHPSLRTRPSSSSEKEMARWWEFAPWATQWEREAVVRKVMSGGGGMELHDLCSAVRADGLLEALPHLPLPKTELMPALVQADATYEPAASRKSSAQLCATSLDARYASLAIQPRCVLELYNLSIYLGISPRKYPQLLWLSSALVSAQIPLGWVEIKVPVSEGGGVYYYNSSLGFCQWEAPSHAHLRGVGMYLMDLLCSEQTNES
ncbi:MAG: hypothetical protein SGPRY_008317 [Prymnesium sp.]